KTHIDGPDVTLQDAARALKSGQSCPRIAGVVLRQQHVDRIIDPQVPAPRVDPNRSADPASQIGLAPQHPEEPGGVTRGVVADNGREPGKAAQVLDRDYR